MLHSHLDLETSIRQFDKSQTETAVWPGKVGVGISPEAPSIPSTDKWQETTCMVVRFRGSHQEAPAPYKTLLQFIREHSLPITGFYREITRLLFPHLQQSPCLLILDFQHGTTIFTLFQPQLLNRCTAVWTSETAAPAVFASS